MQGADIIKRCSLHATALSKRASRPTQLPPQGRGSRRCLSRHNLHRHDTHSYSSPGCLQAHLSSGCWDAEARGQQSSTQGRGGRHTCRARRKREDEDDDLEEDLLSSRGSNTPDGDEDEDDDPEDADPSSDPTARLFRMANRGGLAYEDEDEEEGEEEAEDDAELDDGVGDVKRGKKRKTKSEFEAASEAEFDDEDDDDVGVKGGKPSPLDVGKGPLDGDLDDGVDLDAIMGDTFLDDDEDLGLPDADEESEEDVAAEDPEDPEGPLPSRATQHRPEDGEDEEADGDEKSEEDFDDEDGLGPALSYKDPPERRYALKDLLEMCAYEMEDDIQGIEVTGVQNMATEVEEGDIYICTSSLEYNGYDFIPEALERGAVAVVSALEVGGDFEEPVIMVENTEEALRRFAIAFYGDPSKKMLTVGVTGSLGKTTTCWLVRGIFEEMELMTGMIGSLEYALYTDKLTPDGDFWKPDEEDTTAERECSAPFHLTRYTGKYAPPPTTPDTLRVQKLMAGMADRGASACVYELDLLGVENEWARGVDLDVAIYMGLEEEDIQIAGGIGPLLQAQWRIFSALNDPTRQTAVINMDDPYYQDIQSFARKVPSVTFSVSSKDADVYVDKATFDMWETEVTIATPAGKLQLSSTLVGQHNLPNILAAVAAGLALTVNGDGIPLKAIVQGIEATEVVPGRCEVIDEDQSFGVIIDSANTPKALSRLLDSVREMGPRRIILVVGCEGERDRDARPFIGEIAHYKADLVILTNNNPRGEDPAHIIADIVAGYPDPLLEHNARQIYPSGFLQDPGRIPFEALEFSWQNCFEFRRYVMEDRWTAIRWAIGTAQKKDCVVLAGKGAEDFQEWDIGYGLMKGWFDDRVECRNALSKLSKIALHDSGMDRKDLPWMETDERADNPRIFNLNVDNLARWGKRRYKRAAAEPVPEPEQVT